MIAENAGDLKRRAAAIKPNMGVKLSSKSDFAVTRGDNGAESLRSQTMKVVETDENEFGSYKRLENASTKLPN